MASLSTQVTTNSRVLFNTSLVLFQKPLRPSPSVEATSSSNSPPTQRVRSSTGPSNATNKP